MMQLDTDLHTLLTRPEDLHPDLEPYIQPGPLGQFLNAPLVQSIALRPGFCALENAQYNFKRERLQEARREHDITTFIALHERPFRLNAFLEFIADEHPLTSAAYWAHLADTWIDSENIHQNRRTWLKLWLADRPDRHAAMSARDKARLRLLPDFVTVYRGVNHPEQAVGGGLSWTLSLEKARWFARRGGQPANQHVYKAFIQKTGIVALFLGRGEEEVVLAGTVNRFSRVEP